VLAGKSKIEEYFPEFARYTTPDDGKANTVMFLINSLLELFKAVEIKFILCFC
jgi:hypothetical protein